MSIFEIVVLGAVFGSCLDDNAEVDDIDAEADAINAEDIDAEHIDDDAEADEIDTRLALVRPVLGDIALVVTLPLIILLPAMHDHNECICDHGDEDDGDERDHGDEDDDDCAQLRRHLRSLLHDL